MSDSNYLLGRRRRHGEYTILNYLNGLKKKKDTFIGGRETTKYL